MNYETQKLTLFDPPLPMVRHRDIFIDPNPLRHVNLRPLKIFNFVKIQLKETQFSFTLLKLAFKQIIWTEK